MNNNQAIVAGLAIFLGMMVVLIPITGLTARIALRPMMEALGRYRELQGQNEAQQLLERRVALMEEQLHGIERAVREVVDASEFHRQLDGAAGALPASRVPEAVPAERVEAAAVR
jgi:uncharacterized protein (DUF2164 family)